MRNNDGSNNAGYVDVPDDYEPLNEGEWVESKLNTNVFGIVVGSSGLHVHVQLSPSLIVQAFHEATLRRMEVDDEVDEGGDRIEEEQIDYTNVVDLASARAKGAA